VRKDYSVLAKRPQSPDEFHNCGCGIETHTHAYQVFMTFHTEGTSNTDEDDYHHSAASISSVLTECQRSEHKTLVT